MQVTPEEYEGVSFRLNIPESTSSSKSGPIYVQIQGSSTTEWLAIGQGERMAGSNMLIVYSSSSSNITLSPRISEGHSEPQLNREADVTLLEGSGISDGVMTANVRCDSCISWEGGSMDPSAPNSPWIWAVKTGSPLESTDLSESLQHHDLRGDLTFDHNKATGGNSENPFRGLPVPESLGDASPVSMNRMNTMRAAHGIIMSITFVILFPLFALSLYVIPYSKTVPRIHAPLQIFALCLAIAGFGIGVSLAREQENADEYHPKIGYVVVGCLVLFQPAFGLAQHIHFRKTQQRGSYGVLHAWFGRSVLLLGIINGGLGFLWSGIGEPGTPKSAAIAYVVVAAIMVASYAGVILFSTFRKRNMSRSTMKTPNQ